MYKLEIRSLLCGQNSFELGERHNTRDSIFSVCKLRMMKPSAVSGRNSKFPLLKEIKTDEAAITASKITISIKTVEDILADATGFRKTLLSNVPSTHNTRHASIALLTFSVINMVNCQAENFSVPWLISIIYRAGGWRYSRNTQPRDRVSPSRFSDSTIPIDTSPRSSSPLVISRLMICKKPRGLPETPRPLVPITPRPDYWS